MKPLQTVDLKNKRVVVRTDFNVPIKGTRVLDDFKICAALPTVKLLLRNNCQIVLVSHLGRPNGHRVASMSLKPIFAYLKKAFSKNKIVFIDAPYDSNLVTKVRDSKAQIILLENIRYDSREESNSADLGRLLAKLGDIYINEAFSVSHREAASLVSVCDFIPAYAGLALAAEVQHLSYVLKPNRPSVAIIAGAKIDTKVGLIKKLTSVHDCVLLGGGLANTCLVASGYDVGASLVDKDCLALAKSLMKNKKIILPQDVVVANKKTRVSRVVEVGDEAKLCKSNEMILDIGPMTEDSFSSIIHHARTIVWNGPMGFAEEKKFAHGSISIAKAMALATAEGAVSVAGGGETVMAIHVAKVSKILGFVSSAGGAMLEFLEGKKLPGIKNLK